MHECYSSFFGTASMVRYFTNNCHCLVQCNQKKGGIICLKAGYELNQKRSAHHFLYRKNNKYYNIAMQETKWEFYTENERAWEAMLNACKEAKESIDLEQFIFVPDDVGNQFIEVCEERAKAGVKVRFIWDASGSWSFFNSSIIDNLKEKGIEMIFFRTLLPEFMKMSNYRSWYFRNHRRTLVIDKKVGFTGSVCTWEKIVDWKDTHIKIEGRVVEDMQITFNRMWDRAHGKKVPRKHYNKKRDYEFQYITNNPVPRNRHLYKKILEGIKNAKKYIYITTPYFVPTHRLARVIRQAARRGIDVKIIMPKASDHPIVDLGARTFFHNLLKSGVKIYLHNKDMIHKKTIIIDCNWASMGTLNMDNISLRYNFEANIVSTNIKFAEDLLSHFTYDMQYTEEVTISDWNNRFFLDKIIIFFAKFIRRFL